MRDLLKRKQRNDKVASKAPVKKPVSKAEEKNDACCTGSFRIPSQCDNPKRTAFCEQCDSWQYTDYEPGSERPQTRFLSHYKGAELYPERPNFKTAEVLRVTESTVEPGSVCSGCRSLAEHVERIKLDIKLLWEELRNLKGRLDWETSHPTLAARSRGAIKDMQAIEDRSTLESWINKAAESAVSTALQKITPNTPPSPVGESPATPADTQVNHTRYVVHCNLVWLPGVELFLNAYDNKICHLLRVKDGSIHGITATTIDVVPCGVVPVTPGNVLYSQAHRVKSMAYNALDEVRSLVGKS